MKHRDETIWTAQFSGLRLHAFGIPQTLHWATRVEIYQARANPELWRARPTFTHGQHNWEARTPEELRSIISADFEQCLVNWQEFPAPRSLCCVLPDFTPCKRRRLPA